MYATIELSGMDDAITAIIEIIKRLFPDVEIEVSYG